MRCRFRHSSCHVPMERPARALQTLASPPSHRHAEVLVLLWRVNHLYNVPRPRRNPRISTSGVDPPLDSRTRRNGIKSASGSALRSETSSLVETHLQDSFPLQSRNVEKVPVRVVFRISCHPDDSTLFGLRDDCVCAVWKSSSVPRENFGTRIINRFRGSHFDRG